MIRGIVFTFSLLAATALDAGTVIVSQGTTPDFYSLNMGGPNVFTGYGTQGWTTGSSGYSNVEIDATLGGLDQLGGDVVDAYLTTSIGQGTTSLDEIASSLGIAVSNDGYSSIALFTGLSLNANQSYYLTIAPEGSDRVSWGSDSSQPAPVLDTGVSLITGAYCTDDVAGCADYAPASPFGSWDANFIFSATEESSTPEPASGALLITGAGLVWLRRRSAVK